ncbi:MAG: metallophosphoesterase [Betaproteobacteria bacterium]|nr:metallophosphoesterase [Betaproteobacteria bacterium]
MKRLLQPFVLIVTAILALGYAYVALRLGAGLWDRLALAVPFLLVWIVPVVYWSGDREGGGRLDEALHVASYLSMAWLSFLLVLTLARDVLLLATVWAPASTPHLLLREHGAMAVVVGSFIALVVGALVALRGPHVCRVDIPIEGLHPDLEGFRIVQISDLHVGLTIRRRYVERVVELAESLTPDMIALTGDIVDGSVAALAPHVEPLRRLTATPTFFILGNHDCYSGAAPWIAHFKTMGMRVLLNSNEVMTRGAARLLIGGVVDPALRMSNPDLEPRADHAAANGGDADLRVLLAHNPKLAPLGARAGFDLQLSGHTHAGQFFPWTLAVRLVHAPHVAGLSREGRMHVYVSAGTGTWGPPVRFGTKPELTVVRLVAAGGSGERVNG